MRRIIFFPTVLSRALLFLVVLPLGFLFVSPFPFISAYVRSPSFSYGFFSLGGLSKLIPVYIVFPFGPCSCTYSKPEKTSCQINARWRHTTFGIVCF